MSSIKSVTVTLVYLALLVSCVPAAPTESAKPGATAAPAATSSPMSPTRPPPTMAPIVGRLHCPDCAQEGKAIDLYEHSGCGGLDPCLVVGQARHGAEVHVLTWSAGLRIDAYRVRVAETGLVGWVLSEHVVIP